MQVCGAWMQSNLSVCDIGDLLRQLTVVDVDLLSQSSVVSCPMILARRVTSRPARRRILDVYVNSRNGSANHSVRPSVCLAFIFTIFHSHIEYGTILPSAFYLYYLLDALLVSVFHTSSLNIVLKHLLAA